MVRADNTIIYVMSATEGKHDVYKLRFALFHSYLSAPCRFFGFILSAPYGYGNAMVYLKAIFKERVVFLVS